MHSYMDLLQLTFCNIESLTSNKMHLISLVTVRCKKKRELSE
jgi:hypothetical protein